MIQTPIQLILSLGIFSCKNENFSVNFVMQIYLWANYYNIKMSCHKEKSFVVIIVQILIIRKFCFLKCNIIVLKNMFSFIKLL